MSSVPKKLKQTITQRQYLVKCGYGWITIKVPKWDQISYKMIFIPEHQIWWQHLRSEGYICQIKEHNTVCLPRYSHLTGTCLEGVRTLHIDTPPEEIVLWHITSFMISSNQVDLFWVKCPFWVSVLVSLLGFSDNHHALNCLHQSCLYFQSFY